MAEIRALIDVRIAINKYVTEMAKLLPADTEETEQILDRIAALVPDFGFDRDQIRAFVLGITLPKLKPCNAISSTPAPISEEEADEIEESEENEEIAEEEDCDETVDEVVVEPVIETPPPSPKKKPSKPSKKKKRAYKFLTDEELLHLMEYIPSVDGLYHTDACDVICKSCPSISKKTIGRVLSKTTFKNKTDEFFDLINGIVLSNKKKK